jgi:hypothetical protein
LVNPIEHWRRSLDGVQLVHGGYFFQQFGYTPVFFNSVQAVFTVPANAVIR